MSRRNIRAQHGQTMVEFTLVVPILFVILVGIFQFGALYNDYVTLTDATRVGARKAAVSRHSATPEADAEAAVRSAASDIDEACAGGEGLCVEVDTPAWEHGETVVVRATYPYEIDLLGLVVASGELTSETTERVE